MCSLQTSSNNTSRHSTNSAANLVSDASEISSSNRGWLVLLSGCLRLRNAFKNGKLHQYPTLLSWECENWWKKADIWQLKQGHARETSNRRNLVRSYKSTESEVNTWKWLSCTEAHFPKRKRKQQHFTKDHHTPSNHVYLQYICV